MTVVWRSVLKCEYRDCPVTFWCWEPLSMPRFRQKACEDGWIQLRYPGAPWRSWDLCPIHRDTSPEHLEVHP